MLGHSSTWRNNLPELVLLALSVLIALLLTGVGDSLAQREGRSGAGDVGPGHDSTVAAPSVAAPSGAAAADVRAARLAARDTAPGRRAGGNPIDGQRAYEYLKQICAIGRRVSGTAGMVKQQQMLADHFDQLGGKVSWQRFRARHPVTGKPVSLANLIVEWHPQRKERILLCVHYDTRPLPDEDPNPRNRQSGTFLGANDGASGVALLMELGHLMPELESRYGVDFLFVDGEELVYNHRGTYFLGSEWFSRQYVQNPPGHKYVWGVVLDMIGDAYLQIYQEKNSLSWRETRPLVAQIWDTARRLGVREFIPQGKYMVRDDHLKLRNVAKIPTCDVIDFDYGPNNGYWHTTADLPNKCSGDSLAKVGWVIYEWLGTATPPPAR